MTTIPCNNACGGSCCKAPETMTPRAQRGLTIALAGQPNTGKSTLFNRITGANQHVGNWPGKTVEKKEGFFKIDDETVHLFDLPGTYSLTASSVEERIARQFVLEENPDLVVAVVDATQLERSLYMVAELSLLEIPMVVAINKMDLAEKRCIHIDTMALSSAMGMPVVPVSAFTRKGLEPLFEILKHPVSPSIFMDEMIEAFGESLKRLPQIVQQAEFASVSHRWFALKLLEGDAGIEAQVRSALSPDAYDELQGIRAKAGDGLRKGTEARYRWIESLLAESGMETAPLPNPLGRFDRLAIHPIWGKPLALLILAFGILAAYVAAIPLMVPGMLLFFSSSLLQKALTGVGPQWLAALVGSGLVSGLSAGLIILGFIGGVFFVMGILENTGYLARLAYIFDPLMKRLGLHGKSVLPILMGLVCNIAGVAGSRTIDTWRQRMATLMMVPIIPCKALLVVVAFICGIFFGGKAVLIMLSLFGVMALHLYITSRLLHRHVLPGESTGLLMELPPYQRPDFKSVCLYSFTHMKAFYKKGFWFVVIFSFCAWAGIYFPGGSINTSYLATLGRTLEPLGEIMGFDWRLSIAFVIAFLSKEATLASMAIIFGAASSANTDVMGMASDAGVMEIVHNSFRTTLADSGLHPASILAFVYAIFFSLPCFSTLGVIYSETRSVKWTAGSLAYYLSVSILMGMLAYRIGLLIFA